MENSGPANPYVAPASELNQGFATDGRAVELAERGTRLVAVSIDGLLASVPLVPGLCLGMVAFIRALGAADVAEAAAANDPAAILSLMGGGGLTTALVVASLLGGIGVLGICIYQWLLIARTGQTLGKKWTGIRIEQLSGARVTFGSGVLLRNWVPKILGAVPYAGWVFTLIDCLYIFREDHRCLHDHIAGTRVVRVAR